MSHLQNYQLVESNTLADFHITISGLIGQGWELHGSTQVIITRMKNVYGVEMNFLTYYQAMVLLKDEGAK